MSKKQLKRNLVDFQFQYDHILIKALKAEATNGLVRPDQIDDKPEYGEVIAVGQGRLLENGTVVPLNMKPGDIVFFGKYSSISTRQDGTDYLVIRADDVMAVYENAQSSKKA